MDTVASDDLLNALENETNASIMRLNTEKLKTIKKEAFALGSQDVKIIKADLSSTKIIEEPYP